MNGSRPDDRLTEFEDRWREWAATESGITEDQIRATLPASLPLRKKRPVQVALLAVAASLVLVLVGVRSIHYLSGPVGPQQLAEAPTIVHRLDENIVLFISKDSEPVYIMLADVPAGKGDPS